MSGYTILWLILTALFVVCEIFTMAFVSIWFICGAFIALIIAMFDTSLTVQILVFLFISFVTLMLLRPLAVKYMKPKAKSNLDAIINSEAIVLETIDNIHETGHVKLKGQEWGAISENGNIIEKDKIVVVQAITGIKLIVKEKNND